MWRRRLVVLGFSLAVGGTVGQLVASGTRDQDPPNPIPAGRSLAAAEAARVAAEGVGLVEDRTFVVDIGELDQSILRGLSQRPGDCTAVVAAASGYVLIDAVLMRGPPSIDGTAQTLVRSRGEPRVVDRLFYCAEEDHGFFPADPVARELEVRTVPFTDPYEPRFQRGTVRIWVLVAHRADMADPDAIAHLPAPPAVDLTNLGYADHSVSARNGFWVGSATFLLALVLGLLIERSRRHLGQTRTDVTARRFTFSMPRSERTRMEAVIEPALSSPDPGRAAATVLDSLLAALPEATHVAFQSVTLPPVEARVQVDRWIRDLRQRAANARPSTRDGAYRGTGGGSVVVSLVVGRRRALSELPTSPTRDLVADALKASLPTRSREVAGLEVVWTPGDPTESLGDEERSLLFPELVGIGTRPATVGKCPGCQALVPVGSESCPACHLTPDPPPWRDVSG